ncbi:MAG: PEP/pyruvate-binding domain-containing protein [Chloroflexota bacterium]
MAAKPYLPTPLVLPLDAPEATLALAGGKGASLAVLARAGLPVPEGFHLTTHAYRLFVQVNDLRAPLEAAWRGARADDPASLERASGAIRALFAAAVVPAEISVAVAAAYARLGQPPVAVRSSATSEDLPGMSFAGQQESYLNVRGEGALLEGVVRCWASLWTARAIAYRLKMGVDQGSVAMAVVVQTLVPSEVSGVLFTANPTTGERGELVVNACYGLGEAVVSGQVTPDSYLVDRGSLAVKEMVVGAKDVEVVPGDGQGTTTREVPEERRTRQALGQGELRELAELSLRVERLCEGVPQDLEWAAAEGRVHLLQARPMTGLPPAPLHDVRWEPPIPGSAWIRRQVVENMPEPLSPLFDELYLQEGLEQSAAAMQAAMGVPRAFMDLLFDQPMFATVNGYAYMRGNMKLRWWSVPVLLPLTLGAMAMGVTKMLRNAGINYWRDEVMPAYLSTIERWKKVDPAASADGDILRGLRELARGDAIYWFAVALAMGTAKSTDVTLDRFLGIALPGQRLSSALFLRGFQSRAVDAEAELEGIAARIRGSDELRETVAATPAPRLLDALANSPLGQPVAEALRGYLDRYGHQIYSLDFAVPTLAEDPLPVLLSLKMLVGQPQRNVRAQQEALARERDRLVEETAQSLDPLRRGAFLRLLRMAQRFAPYREESLFHVGAAWPTLRRLALELGRRLAEAGSLKSADDVFFLDTRELAAASEARARGEGRPDLAALARERRELREARKQLHPPAAVPPRFRWKLGPIDLAERESQRRDTGDGPLLHGFAVSPGRVTAQASVILSPAHFDEMVPDTILVCPATTPAWTPLFSQARGLVTDIGAVAAHGSIVAREYGIPAVMGTGNATRRIANGQKLTVDGYAGTVVLDGEEGADLTPAPETSQLHALSVWRGRGRLVLVAAVLFPAIFWVGKRRNRL